MLRANEHAAGTVTKGGKRAGSGAKRKHFATAEKSSKQVANAASARVAMSLERKDQLVKMLKKQLGST